MESIKDLFKGSTNQIIEMGQISSVVGSNSFMVSFNGTERKAYSTLNQSLQVGQKVIVTKLVNNSRYIVGKTSFSGEYTEQKEIFRNG